MYYVQLDSGTILQTQDPSLWPEAKRLSAKKGKELLRAEAIKDLRERIKPGDTVYTLLRHVSRSGMFRRIDLYIMEDGEPRCITHTAANAMGYGFAESGKGIGVGGCGMDMGFHLVYELSHTLFHDAFYCIGRGDDRGAFSRCPSNDHANGDRDYSPGHKHSDGGYALRHRWM